MIATKSGEKRARTHPPVVNSQIDQPQTEPEESPEEPEESPEEPADTPEEAASTKTSAQEMTESEVQSEDEKRVTVTDKRSWTLILDPKDYKVVSTDQAKVDEIIQVLLSDDKTTIDLVGINDLSRSSRRALQGANSVRRQIIADKNIVPWRVTVNSTQREGLSSLIVEANIIGGTK